jgi:metallo-beta-lactamase family protein
MARIEHAKTQNPHVATLTFWGGVGTVTGSKYLIETKNSKVLIDCGLFQGLKELRDRNWQAPPFDPTTIDAVVLTHAHTDHVGYLPALVKNGFKGEVYCTRATAELARIILEDSAELQEEEADWRNKKGLTEHHPALPLYDRTDVKRTMKLFRPQKSGTEGFQAASDIRVQWWPAGHMLGARSLRVEVSGAGAHGETRSIVFSGDIGRWNQPVLKDPVTPPPADYVLIESTYGDRLHDEEDPRKALAEVIKDAHERGAPVLIPAFSVGRTQDILYHIRELEDAGEIPIVPVRADSPMAAEATQAYLKMAEEHDDETRELTAERRNPLRTKSMGFSTSREQSRRLNEETGARVIVSASGMMTGGRVMHHARQLVSNPEATICFVGFQAAGTTGRRILDAEPEIKIFKEWFPVRCRVKKIGGFSGHADYLELLAWLAPLDKQAPRLVSITHGEPEAATALAQHIKDRFGWNVQIPSYGTVLELV